MINNNSPFFSIIIPTYNREVHLSATLDAISVQTFIDYEVIIIDDGGTDDTENRIRTRHDPRLKFIKTSNRERGAARNEGVNHAKGRYVTFLDSDDIPYPDLLENAYSSIFKFNEAPFVHIAYEIKEPNGKINYRYDFLRSDDKKILVEGNPLSCIGAFIRKDIALLHRFNEDRALSGSEDWELWLRIVAHHGIKINNTISAAMINHAFRSVKQTDPEKLYKRKELALKYSFADEKVQAVYGSSMQKIEAFADSYISLHLALSGYRKHAIAYLFRSILGYPLILLNRRPLVIIKRIIIGR